MPISHWKSSWLRLPDGARFLARSSVQALLAAVLGVVAGAFVLWVDRTLGSTLPASIETARSLVAALVTAIVTLAVFTLWMRSIVVGLASSQISPRLVSSYLDDAFQWRLLVGMSAAITFTATVLLGLPMDEQELAPALSVSLALLTVVLGLVMVLMALRQGVHSLAPPRIVHSLAVQARDAMLDDGVPDDPWPPGCSRLPPEPRAWIAATDMGWVVSVDHTRLMERLPAEAHLGLVVDVGAFVAVGDVLATCDTQVGDDAERAIRNCITVHPARSPDHDLGFALQQLRDLAQQALVSHQQDTSTAFEALLYLRVVLGELIVRHEPTGDALGPEGRAVTSIARRRTQDHIQDTLEPLVHLASQDPLSKPDVHGVLNDLVSVTERACGALDRNEVLDRLSELRRTLGGTGRASGLPSWPVAVVGGAEGGQSRRSPGGREARSGMQRVRGSEEHP